MASVTTLALMGMTAFSVNIGNVSVKADDVSYAGQNQPDSDNISENQGASAATNSMAAQSGADSTYTDAYNGATAAKSAYDNYAKSNGTSSYYPEYNSQSDNNTTDVASDKNNQANADDSGNQSGQKVNSQPTADDTNKQDNYATQTSAAQASATSYESSLTNSANSNNASVSLASGAVSVPTSDKNDSTDAYKYGVNYFLASQGATDARTGKWNGCYYDKDGNKKLSSYAPDSTSSNAYDQGYLGAQYAISQQFNQDDSINSSLTAADVSKNDQYYQDAYNDTLKQIQSGTAFVSNGNQFNNVINNSENTNTIKLIDDIDVSDNSSTRRDLTIDGQNHIADMNNYSNTLGNNLHIENFRTIYDSNYYGAFKVNSGGNLYYKNVNYIGSQMLSATDNNVFFDGNVNTVMTSQYTSPFTTANSGGQLSDNTQENFEVKNFTLMPNAHFFGVTNKAGGGNNIYLTGNMTLGNDSSMNLISRGKSGATGINGSNYAIRLNNGSSSLNIQHGAQLNIIPTISKNDSNNANAIYNLGSIYVNGGQINIEANGNSQNSNRLIDNQKDIKITNNGSINVHLANLGSNTSDGIIYNDGGTIYIVDQGNMSVSADGSGQVNLIKGNLNINNPGSQGVHLDLSQNTGEGSTFHDNNSIVAYSTKVNFAVNDENNPLYKFKYDGSTANYVKADGTNTTVTPSTSIKSINFSGVPYVSMDNVSIDNDVHSNPVLDGYVSVNNYDGKDKTIYVQFASGNGNDYNQLKSLNGNTINEKPASDLQTYNVTIPIPDNYKSGDLISISDLVIPNLNNNSATSVGVLMRYGVTGSTYVYNNVNSSNPSYTRQVENIGLNNNKLSADSNSDSNNQPYIVTQTGNYSDFRNGFEDGVADANNQNDSAFTNSQASATDVDYHDAYDSAKAGYLAYINNPIDKTDSIPDSVTAAGALASHPKSYINGYIKAMNDIDTAKQKGKSDATNYIVSNTSATKLTDNSYTSQARVNAYNDVQNGWLLGKQNARNNIGNDNDGNNPIYRDAYKNGYDGTMDSYQDTLNERNRNIINQPDLYQVAYKLANPDALNDKSAALNDFKHNVNKSKNYIGMDKLVYDHFYPVVNDYYAPTQDKRNGFKDAIDKLMNMDSDSVKYNDDYKLGINMLSGIKAAQSENNLTAFERNSKPLGYVDGFDGYKTGYKLGASGINYSKADKNKAYDFAYAKGYVAGKKDISKVAVSEARKQAKKLRPMLNMDNRSADFINAYKQAYDKAIKSMLPEYIYNRKAIYTHSKDNFKHSNRVHKYDKESVSDAKTFKVIGYAFDESGKLRYKLSNGTFVAADDSVDNLYYTKINANKEYKVIAKHGIYLHDNVNFNDEKGKKLNEGATLKPVRIIELNGITRFYLSNGKYVTSNKKFVAQI